MSAADTREEADLALELSRSGLFDRDFYARRNSDVTAAGLDPLEHFVRWGWQEGRWPNRYFDPAWYRLANADLAAAGIDPLLHYLRHGQAEERPPHPAFDPAWYRAAYAVPPEIGVLTHFLAHRTRQPASPGAALWAVPLIPPWRDALASRRDPVEHYLDDREARGLEPFPDPDIVAASGLVEDNYYLINAADVHEAKVDPVDHYCRYGWREHRKPNLYFDPVWYEQTNPEVTRIGINPLLHYIVLGEAADRRPVPFFDPGWYRAQYAVPDGQVALAHFLAHRRSQTVSPTPLFDVAWYVSRFGAALGPSRDPFAHYLQAGMTQNIDPSPGFNAALYRRTHMGRPSRGFARLLRPEQHNPLVHYLRAQYGAAKPAG
ncbi:hypothetical protein [Rhodopila sp.]|jgi:hypothetical protein|uniref:hypothetical protein n=1 Tax=Rhodopila sp. TaxID=2480087 RepID=UPI002C8DCDEC|nr:hypothetical protein [Rhodopila sp.]HVZ08212.1 hypothetical protein [Rhodopila sp.]